jgi:GAF domain-containing protein/ActR/RegA family two-component response regulator
MITDPDTTPQAEDQATAAQGLLALPAFLYDVSLLINQARTEQEVVRAICDTLSTHSPVSGLVVLFRDQPEPCGEVPGYWDDDPGAVAPPRWLQSTSFGGSTQIWNRIARNRDIDPELQRLLLEAGARSAAIIPFRAPETLLGALMLKSRDEAAFTPAGVRPYETLALQAATALRNQRLLAVERQRSEELANLVAISRTFAAITDLDRTLEELTRRLARMLGAERCLIALYDPATREIVGQAPAYGVPEAVARSFRYAAGSDLRRQWNLRRQGPFVSNHPATEIASELQDFVVAFGVRSLLVVPLISQERVVGVMYAANKAGGFHSRDMQLATVLASQAATIIRHAQTYQEQQRRARELDVLNQISATASSSLSLDDIFQQTLAQLTDVLSCEMALVALFDTQRKVLELAAGFGMPASLQSALAEAGMEKTLCALTASGDAPRLEPDIRQASAAGIERLVELGFLSYLGAPLIADGQVLGTICGFSHTADHFTLEHSQLLSDVSRQIGLAVRNALRYNQIQQRALQIQTAAEISRSASSVLDLDTLFSETVDLIHHRFGYHYVGLFLVDEAQRWAVLQAGTGESGRELTEAGYRLEVAGQSTIGLAVTKCKAQIALARDQEWVRFSNPLLEDTRSELALPLISRGEVIGALTVQSMLDSAFDDEDMTILQTMADQLANAINNARFVEQFQSSLAESERLHRRYIRQQWDIHNITKSSEGRSGFDYDLMRVVPVDEVSPIDGGDNGRHPGAQTLSANLQLGGETIGTLGAMAQSPEYHWSEDEVAIVNAVAEQTAQALETAYHSEQSERRAAQLSAAAQIGQSISSAMTAEAVIKHAIVQIAQLFRLCHVGIFFLDESETNLVLQQATGHAGAIMKDSHYSFPLDDQDLVCQAARERQPCIALDIDPGRTWARNPLLPDARSQLTVPLVASGQLLGVLDVQSAQAAAFDQVDAAVFQTIADQVSATLESARLFEETRRRAADQQMLFEVTTAAVTTADLDEMLQRVAESLHYSLGGANVAIMLLEDDLLAVRAAAGFGELEQQALEIHLGEGVTGWVALTGEPLIIGDVTKSPRYIAGASQTRSELAVPVVVDNQVAGVINVEADELESFDKSDLQLLQTLCGTLGSILKSFNLVAELQAANQQLHEVDKLKSQFLANMSHELRTPLNSIIGFSRVILKGIDGPVTELQKQDLSSIYSSGQHLLGLINDILDHSKIEAGKMEMMPEAVQVAELIRGVMSTAVGLTKDKDIELIQEVPEDLPPVWADPFRLRQVLLNLVSNAAKFTERGSIYARAAYDEQAVFIQVIDTGQGISESDTTKLFHAFSQVDASSTRKVGGTGLGLAISAQLVELQGGRIWVESELRKGSTFSIAMPRVNEQGDGPVIILPPDRATTLPLQAQPSAQPKRILCVDDETGVINLYQRYLDKDGFRVTGATSGKEGLRLAVSLADELVAVTVDVLMPDMDGWELIRRLRENPRTKNLPIIVCSIRLDPAQAHIHAIEHYLVKPILQEDLLAAVRECQSTARTHPLVPEQETSTS